VEEVISASSGDEEPGPVRNAIGDQAASGTIAGSNDGNGYPWRIPVADLERTIGG